MKATRILAALTLAMTFQLSIELNPASANFHSSGPITYLNSTSDVAGFVPAGISWGSKSISAAKKAENYLESSISKELTDLTGKGATSIKRVFVSTKNNAYPDWKTYVPSFNQFILKGYDANGKLVGSSSKLPVDTATLASRLVYLNADTCSLTTTDQTLPNCTIVKASPEDFLRASLRTAIGMGMLEDITGFVLSQLETCLTEKYKFTIKNGVFDCPDNAGIFGGSEKFPLVATFKTKGYKIVVNQKNRTATVEYTPRSFAKIALTGAYRGGAVVGFSG